MRTVFTLFFLAFTVSAHAGDQIGLASWYGSESGTRTASGEKFNQWGMTAAHRTLPFGSVVRVTNLATGETCVVRINDRGPYIRGRIIDLSRGAARACGIRGVGRVLLHKVR